MIEKSLQIAIDQGRKVKIIYLKDQMTQLRILEPRTIKEGLLTALDLEKRKIRNFSLVRILAVSIIREEDSDD